MSDTSKYNNKETLKKLGFISSDEFNHKLDNETKLNYVISVLNDYMKTKEPDNNNHKLESSKFLKNHDNHKIEAIESVLGSDEFMLFSLKQYKLLIYKDNEIFGKEKPTLLVYKMSDKGVSSCLRRLFKIRNN